MSNCCTGGEARKKSSFSCQCEDQKATSLQQHHETREINKIRYIVIGIVALAVWWVVYSGIVPLSQWIAYDLFPLEKGSPLGDSVEFFFYEFISFFKFPFTNTFLKKNCFAYIILYPFKIFPFWYTISVPYLNFRKRVNFYKLVYPVSPELQMFLNIFNCQ